MSRSSRNTPPSALVLNLPYSGGSVPPPVGKHLGWSPEDWRLEHWRLTDPHLVEIVREAAIYEGEDGPAERPLLVYPYSPLVADPWGLWAAELGGQRVADDFPPGPAIIPRSTSGQTIEWSERDRELIFERTVSPYYRQIEEAARNLLADRPLVLSITLRSYSSKPQAFESSRLYPRPRVCVSAWPGPTPQGLVDLIGGTFQAFHWWPELGWPHERGACLPPGLVGHPRMRAIGLSLDRSLYMDEHNGRLLPAAEGVARVLRTLFNLLDQELNRVAQRRLERRLKPKPSSIIKAGRL